MTDADATSRPLSDRQTEIVLAAVADAVTAELPLAAGLRAAAAETPQRRVAAVLRDLADQLDHGRPWEDVLVATSGGLAGCIAGLVGLGLGQGRLGPVLVELVDHQRRLREQRQSLASALAYPAVLLVLASAVGVFLHIAVVDPLLKLVLSFGLKLPGVTEVVAWFHRSGLWWLLGTTLATLVALLVFRAVAGAARWRRVLATVPLFGSLWHWSGVAAWARLSSLFVQQGVPLPQALRVAAEGVQDANLREVGLQLAAGVQQGGSLAELAGATARLPVTLGPILAWGERSGELAEAFRVAAEMFEGRVHLRSELLRSILPPLVFVVVALWAVVLVAGTYAPMISLIQGLS